MKKLYKAKYDRKICGVCGGLAEYFDLDSTLVRLIMLIIGLISGGSAVLFYLLASILMPEEI